MTIDDSIPNTSAGTGGGPPPAAPLYKQIGRYKIHRELGRGAMGLVLEAEDPKIQRRVALKVLHDVPGISAADLEEFKSRFFREARTAGILSHPNIVVIHDVDSDEQLGISFMAMEYLKGQTIYDLLKGGVKFTTEQAIDICIQVAEGLDHAHRQNIVHRDVKPANLMLLEDGTVKITDFGIAKISTSNLTRTGQFLGTPNYMSPEQVIGHVVDGRSDLFSLGIIVYELLTGEKPFMGSSLTTITYQIVNVDPIEPSKIRPGLTKKYDAVAQKLLRKSPEERYQTGKEVAEALRQARDGGAAAVQAAAAAAAAATAAAGGDADATQMSSFNPAATRVAASPGVGSTTFGPGTQAGGREGTSKAVIAGIGAAVLIGLVAVVIAMTKGGDERPAASAPAPSATAPLVAVASAPGPASATDGLLAGASGPAGVSTPAGTSVATALTPPAGPSAPAPASASAPRRATSAAPATIAAIAPPRAAILLPPQLAPAGPAAAADAKGQAKLKVVFEHKLKAGSFRVEVDGKQVISRDLSAGQRKKDTITAEANVLDGRHEVKACVESAEIQDGPKCATRMFSFVMNREATLRATHGKPMVGPHWFTMELE